MKLPRTVALAALALAILAPLAFAIPSTAPAGPAAPVDESFSLLHSNLTTDVSTTDFERQCFNTCTRVLCTNPQTCGVYTNSSGGQSCGCH